VAPSWLYRPLVRVKQAADLHTATLNQLVVAEVLSDHAFMSAHVQRLRAVYGERADVLARELRARLGWLIEAAPVDGGLFLWARLTDGRRADELLRVAIEHRVAFVPGDAFSSTGGCQDRLRLCFATNTPDQLADAVDRLGAAASVAR
jgi:2-aminoadipate transaminase